MMNNTPVHRFSYHGWNVSIQLDGTDANGAIAAHADLRLHGVERSRIVIDEPFRDCSAALRRLAQGARFFVDDWQMSTSRPAALRAAAPAPTGE